MRAPFPPHILEAFRTATADTSEPCEHGHYDCSTVERGPCAAEAAAVLFAAGCDLEMTEALDAITREPLR